MDDYKRVYDLTRDVREQFILDLNRKIDRLEAQGWPQPETEQTRIKLETLQELTLREIAAIQTDYVDALSEGSEQGFPLS